MISTRTSRSDVKVIIAGSRHMPLDGADSLIQQAVDASGFSVTEVVCGMALGADTWGRLWAQRKGVPVARFPADWYAHGDAAGPIRNRQMAEYADALIVFIYGNSKGSANMLRQMMRLKKPAFVVRDGAILF